MAPGCTVEGVPGVLVWEDTAGSQGESVGLVNISSHFRWLSLGTGEAVAGRVCAGVPKTIACS